MEFTFPLSIKIQIISPTLLKRDLVFWARLTIIKRLGLRKNNMYKKYFYPQYLKKTKILKIKYNEEFRTNGEDVNFSKVLKSKDCNLYYEPKALCYHYQFDDALSLSKRYWRYTYYGAGLKKLTFIRLIKLILRQIKVFFLFIYNDTLNKNYHFFKINVCLSYFFIIFCVKKYLSDDEK